MNVELRLKTGFYETAAYKMIIGENQILLYALCEDPAKDIRIDNDDLLTFLITAKKNPEIEIQTKNKVLSGTLAADIDLDKLFNELKKNFNKKVNYEGGISHA